MWKVGTFPPIIRTTPLLSLSSLPVVPNPPSSSVSTTKKPLCNMHKGFGCWLSLFPSPPTIQGTGCSSSLWRCVNAISTWSTLWARACSGGWQVLGAVSFSWFLHGVVAKLHQWSILWAVACRHGVGVVVVIPLTIHPQAVAHKAGTGGVAIELSAGNTCNPPS